MGAGWRRSYPRRHGGKLLVPSAIVEYRQKLRDWIRAGTAQQVALHFVAAEFPDHLQLIQFFDAFDAPCRHAPG